jgi:predicted TIM-barrel fold metal-dependent hydrolase
VPSKARLENFAQWFSGFRGIRFILAHLNFHEPEVAMALAEEHDNVSVGTSWQPSEAIGEAVRRLGAERVFFGSDWPIVGHNMEVGVARVRDCVTTGTLTEDEAALILGDNASKLLELPCP